MKNIIVYSPQFNNIVKYYSHHDTILLKICLVCGVLAFALLFVISDDNKMYQAIIIFNFIIKSQF